MGRERTSAGSVERAGDQAVKPLLRWLAQWSDGKELVLHADSYWAASDLGRKLVVPVGVSLTRIHQLQAYNVSRRRGRAQALGGSAVLRLRRADRGRAIRVASRRTLPPIAGRSQITRHASATGAAAVIEIWTARQSAYLQLLRGGAKSDQEAADLLKCQLCSVNSVRGALQKAFRVTGRGPEIVSDGFDEHRFTDATGKRRVTRRTRWRIRR